MKNKMVAMILAGGRGSRLHELTEKVAKPAVYYGGKYRIIDFPLSNCANSDVNIVGVLTQYESVLLNAYASAGQRWGLDTDDSGVFVLPPREKLEGGLQVYRGTADAITQNIDFLDQYNPDYVLVLSGDHIYKMNYDLMLDYHQERNADCSIAVYQVPYEEASRFGIMNTDLTGKIYEFEEKPEHPKSNLASMGIYIFNWKTLRKYLVDDMKNTESDHDFGKNIIPTMLNDGKRLFAYIFDGYWKDVGTLDSLWEANMDLIDNPDLINLNDDGWKIYADDSNMLPHYVGSEGEIDKSYVDQGCVVEGVVKHCVLCTNVKVGKGATVENAVVMKGAVIGEGCHVEKCIIGEGVHIAKGVSVGDNKTKNVQLFAKDVKGGDLDAQYIRSFNLSTRY